MNQDFIERFRTALRIKTDWPRGAKAGDTGAEAPLVSFQNFLAESYPTFNKSTERRVLSPYSVVYRWPGTENAKGGNSESAPVLLMGHYDVVPTEAAKWSVDPFAAEIKDGFIYGRGTLDMKNIIAEILESAENLCLEGFKPQRDIWFAFGGDEERTGIIGAKETVRWFSEKGIKFSFVMDEGPSISMNQIKGIDKPLAMVGIEEKGYLSLDLTVEQKPGHASQPPEEQAAGVLARALLRLSKSPFPWLLTPAVEAFFRQLSPYAPGMSGFVMKHARLLGPLFFKAVAVTPATRALLRNTVAMTQLEGSAADNVMPSVVRSVINLRLLPPWTVDDAVKRIRAIINDEKVNVAVRGLATAPVKAGPGQAEQKSPGWTEIINALDSSFKGVPALPFLMPATTDSRHYRELTQYIFRFCPQLLSQEELSRIHGHDERVSLENLEQGLRFYTALIKQL